MKRLIIAVVKDLPAKRELVKIWYELRIKGYDLKFLINKKLHRELSKKF